MISPKALSGHRLSLMHIDTAYTLSEVRAKRHESFFLARHASGLFPMVWSVHPIADVVGAAGGKIDVFRLAPGHVVIEGKAELCRLPRSLLFLNVAISQVQLYRRLVRLVRKHHISVVVSVDPYLSGLLGLAVARRTKRPFVVRISGNHDDLHDACGALAMPRLLPSYRLQRAVQRFVFRRADLVAAINRNNLGFGIANGAQRHTAVIPISANVAAVHRTPPEERQGSLALLERLSIPSGVARLLYLGRLIELKHPDDAVRAMAETIRRHPRTVGILVGVGPMEEQLRALAQELGVASSIYFLGQRTQEELSKIIPNCIMLSPSAGQLAVLECALGGAPIVAYDRDFQPEFIDNGVDGFIVPFRDHQAMADKASLIISNPELAAHLSTAVRRKALLHVDPERVRTLEWEAFSKLLPGVMEPVEANPQ
jgi:glycosyltransferase involved in cell wall biosynthesis